jgi:polyribonucleotide nucleotidyltransferase
MDLPHKSFSTDFMGRPLTLEVSQLGEQANAAVIGSYGGTVVLATVVMDKEDRPIDYLPLMVDYEQKFYSVGKILGGRFMKREGRASDGAVLLGRLIDRTIRPLFDARMRRDIQVVVTVLSYDGENAHEFIGLVAASTALAISDIPWAGPVAGVSVSKIDGALMINSLKSVLEKSEFEGFVAGTADHINMIELEAKESSEKDVVDSFALALKEIALLVDFQKDIVTKIGKPKQIVSLAEPSVETKSKIKAFVENKLEAAIYVKDKVERQNNLDKIKADLKKLLKDDGAADAELMSADHMLEMEIDDVVHKNILESNRRPDGRRLDEVRSLYAETHLFERLHGSALFIRGNT